MDENLFKLECNVAGKICQFSCDRDTPIGHVKESFFQFIKHIGHIEDQVNAQKESSAIEEIKPD